MKNLKHIKEVEVVERPTPIRTETLIEIREILEGVKHGRLLHDQRSFHTQTACGTAHCIAGWKAHNDAAKVIPGLDYTYQGPEEITSEELDEFMYSKAKTQSEWRYAEKEWGLTATEASHLFESHVTLDEQFELLEVLEAGYTVEMESDWLKTY